MNALGMRLGLVLVGACLASLLIVAQGSAVTGDLAIESGGAQPGDEVTVELTANVPSPGLAAWTVDVNVENPSDVSIVDCEAEENSVCNPDYTAAALPTARFAGARATGLVGDISLGTVTFRCADHEGSSDIGLDTVGFADATVGGPVEIAVTFSPGTITCDEDIATATRTGGGPGGGTPTAVVGGLPKAGSGGGSGDGALSLTIAILSAIAVAAIGGYQLIHHRSRRP